MPRKHLSWQRRDTRSASSSRSATRKRARPCPITISGSGVTASVHCGGTEQTAPLSACSNSRLPERLYRSPMQRSCRPPNGWNECVIRTSLAEAAERFAFEGELQAAGGGEVQMAGDQRRGDAAVVGAAGGIVRGAGLETGVRAKDQAAAGGRLSARHCSRSEACVTLTHLEVERSNGAGDMR